MTTPVAEVPSCVVGRPGAAAGIDLPIVLGTAAVAFDPYPAEPTSPAMPSVATAPVSLAVIMPVFNEAATVAAAVNDVLSVDYPCPMQLIVVDDGSTDGSAQILDRLHDPRVTVLHHPANRGKGAALRTGAAAATATHVVPFDADLEYAADDLVPLLEPVLSGRATIVYGSRIAEHGVPHHSKLYAVGNRFMTGLANKLYGADISDLHTCLKLVPREVFRRIPLLEEGFGLDTELTAWLLRSGASFAEVPVTYRSRTRAAGKKIGWRDGVACLHILLLIRREMFPPPTVPRPRPN